MTNSYPSLKYAVVSLGALLATCLCFYLMLLLISVELAPEAEVTTPLHIRPSLTAPREETRLETRKKPQKVLPLQPPPDEHAIDLNRTARVALRAERPTFGSIADLLGLGDINLELEAPVSDLFPLNVVRPVYPLSAAMREIEGFVVVRFSVRENGTVANPVVVDSEPAILFDEAALNAVSRFRFKPREVGGDRLRVDNVQLKFAFNLESLYDLDEAYKP